MTSRSRTVFVFATTMVLLLIAAPVLAHVTVRADNPAAEALAKYTVRVPNESDDAATTKVELELPEGYDEVSHQPVKGWDIEVADGVMTISGGRIEPGQFQEFSFSAQNPAQTGDVTFPAIQTYSDGEESRWVGEADSDKPAPVVSITGEAGGHGAAPAAAEGAVEEAAASTLGPSSAAMPLSIVALLAGLAGLALGGAAFARSRQTR